MSDKKSFNHGYIIAVTNMMNLHNDDVIAQDTFNQLGIDDPREIQAMNLCEYDLSALREFLPVEWHPYLQEKAS